MTFFQTPIKYQIKINLDMLRLFFHLIITRFQTILCGWYDFLIGMQYMVFNSVMNGL